MPRTPRRDPKSEPFWRDLIPRWKTSGQAVALRFPYNPAVVELLKRVTSPG